MPPDTDDIMARIVIWSSGLEPDLNGGEWFWGLLAGGGRIAGRRGPYLCYAAAALDVDAFVKSLHIMKQVQRWEPESWN